LKPLQSRTGSGVWCLSQEFQDFPPYDTCRVGFFFGYPDTATIKALRRWTVEYA
jgi:hypothetical protein